MEALRQPDRPRPPELESGWTTPAVSTPATDGAAALSSSEEFSPRAAWTGPAPIPDPTWPPLPHLVKAATHTKDTVLPLTPDEEAWRGRIIEFALILNSHGVDVPRMPDTLSRALGLYPPAAGRYLLVKERSEIRGLNNTKLALLCNNEGASFTASATEEKAPAFDGPLHERFFDRAIGSEPDPEKEGGQMTGGPLFCVRVTKFSDFTVLALSFVNGLTDVPGMGLFLQTWARIHRGDGQGPPPTLDRAELNSKAFHNQSPPLGGFEFAALHRSSEAGAKAGGVQQHVKGSHNTDGQGYKKRSRPEGEVVACCTLTPEDLKELVAEAQARMRQRRIIYTTDTLSASDLAFAMTAEALGSSVSASLLINYRQAFGFTRHFGVASAFVDLDLDQGSDIVGWIKMLTKTCIGGGNTSMEFWIWKLTRIGSRAEPDLAVSTWVDALPLEKLSFGQPGEAVCLVVGASFWREQQRRGCSMVMLPHPSGGLEMQALVPRAALSKLMGSGSTTAKTSGETPQKQWRLWKP